LTTAELPGNAGHHRLLRMFTPKWTGQPSSRPEMISSCRPVGRIYPRRNVDSINVGFSR